MGALDGGATHREHLLGAIDRDDINWELKSAICAMLEEIKRLREVTEDATRRMSIRAERIEALEGERDRARIAKGHRGELRTVLKELGQLRARLEATRKALSASDVPRYASDRAYSDGWDDLAADVEQALCGEGDDRG